MGVCPPHPVSSSARHGVRAAVVAALLLLAPAARAQEAVYHSCVMSWEDGDPKHDSDGVKDGVLTFGAGKVHVIYRCDAWGNEKIVFGPGAVVKVAQEFVLDQDGNLVSWKPATDGWIRANTLPASVEINGATITDIRDDSVGGDTNQDGDDTKPAAFGAYTMAFNASPENRIEGATIKYCAQFGGIGTMSVTGNTFVSFGGLLNEGAYPGWTGRLVPDAVPVISNNTFEMRNGASALDLRGLSAIVEGNRFRGGYDPNDPNTIGSAVAIRLGPAPVDRNYPDTAPWGNQKAPVIVSGNTIEMPAGIVVEDWSNRRGAFDRLPWRAEIRNNVIRGTSGAGRGGNGLYLALDAPAVIEGNEVSNFSSPLAFSFFNETTTPRLEIHNNRFSLEGYNTSSSPGVPDRFWKAGLFVDVEGNYWGDPSGPYDPSRADTAYNAPLYNPRGRGIRLGDGIDYVPFVGGTVKVPQDYLRITATASPAGGLQRNEDATFTVQVTDLRLRSAPRGRVVVTVRDADGYVLDGAASVDVTPDARTATLPPVTIKVPDDTPFVTVEAALVPEGDGEAARSNVERFRVDRPESSLGFPSVTEIPSGSFPRPVRGQRLRVRAKIPYTLTTSSSTAPGEIEIVVEERIRGTKEAVQRFPVVTLPAPPGIDKTVETEVEIEIPLRDVEKEPKTDLYGKLILKDDAGNELDKQGAPVGIQDAGNDLDVLAVPLQRSGNGGAPFPDFRTHYYATDVPVVGLGTRTQIKTPGVTDWMVNFGPALFLDAAGNVLRRIDPVGTPHLSNLATGPYQERRLTTTFQLQPEPFPAGTRKLRLYARLVAPVRGGVTVALDSVDVEVRENVQAAYAVVPAGASQVSFGDVRATVAFTTNQRAGNLTAEEVREPFAAKAGAPWAGAAAKTSDYRAWQLVPLNRYWSVFGDLQEGTFQARVTFQYDPAVDFPAASGFREDSLVVAGLNPLSGELEVLPSALDPASNTISTDYTTFFQTYVVASKSTVTVQTAAEQAELPADYALEPAYPNPFNPQTTFVFRLPAAGEVVIEVFDVLGRRLRTLVGGPMTAGVHRVVWDGRAGGGAEAASGVYLVRMQAGRFTQVRSAVLVR